ncbi:hypothetical protein Dimus_016042 [Dionaea muscipula]
MAANGDRRAASTGDQRATVTFLVEQQQRAASPTKQWALEIGEQQSPSTPSSSSGEQALASSDSSRPAEPGRAVGHQWPVVSLASREGSSSDAGSRPSCSQLHLEQGRSAAPRAGDISLRVDESAASDIEDASSSHRWSACKGGAHAAHAAIACSEQWLQLGGQQLLWTTASTSGVLHPASRSSFMQRPAPPLYA